MDLLVLSFSSSLHHHHYHFMHFKSKKNLIFIRLPFVTHFHISLFLSLSFRFCVDDLPLVVRTKTVEIKTNWLRYKKNTQWRMGFAVDCFVLVLRNICNEQDGNWKSRIHFGIGYSMHFPLVCWLSQMNGHFPSIFPDNCTFILLFTLSANKSISVGIGENNRIRMGFNEKQRKLIQTVRTLLIHESQNRPIYTTVGC